MVSLLFFCGFFECNERLPDALVPTSYCEQKCFAEFIESIYLENAGIAMKYRYCNMNKNLNAGNDYAKMKTMIKIPLLYINQRRFDYE